MQIDFKKTEKRYYQPGKTPEIIDVPEMKFIAVDGKGDPNTSPAYAAAVELLYGLSYTLKMGNKQVLDYVVPSLEGFWSLDDDFRGSGAAITDKSKFLWTMLIRQPEYVTEALFDAAKEKLAKKKPHLALEMARLVTLTEGLCVQVMHHGPYDDEPDTIAAMDRFALEQGYEMDMGGERRHHEIYLSDPRKTAPEKMRTVLRHPIRRAA